MNKKTTRIIAIVLVLLMALALIPIAASAEGEVTWTYYPDVDENGAPTGTPVAHTYEVGAKFNLPPASTFTKANYTLVKWHRVDPGDEFPVDEFTPGQEMTSSRNCTLYAVWQENPKVTVTFNANYPGGSDPAPSTQQIYANTATPLDALSFSAPAGCTFAGWNTAANGTGTAYAAGGTITASADTALYAQWTYQLTLNGNGGTFPDAGNAGTRVLTYKTNESAQMVTSINVVRPGFTLTGWAMAADGTGEVTGQSIGYSAANPAPVVYAKWAEDLVSVTYAAGTNGTGTASTSQVGRGSTVTLPQPSEKGLRPNTGFAFKNWKSGETEYAAGAEVTVSGDTTFTAQFEAIQYATVYFQPGTGGTGTMTPAAAERGKPYPLPGNGFTPNTNMSFTGWKIGTGDTVYAAGSSYTIPADATEITLTAQWISNTVTVTFNDGTANVASQNMSRTAASALTAYSSMSGVTVPTGKVFAGWSRTSGATAAQFADGESVRWDGAEGTKNYTSGAAVTLYAVWGDGLSGTVSLKESSDGRVKVGQTYTAEVTPAVSGTLYYKWVVGSPDTGWNVVKQGAGDSGKTYRITADDAYNVVFVLVADNADYTNPIASGQYIVYSDDMVTLTVVVVDPAGSSRVTMIGHDFRAGTGTVDVIKGATVKTFLIPGADQIVKSVKHGTKTITPKNTYDDWKFTAPTTITITFGSTAAGTTKTAELSGNTVPSAATSAFAALMSTMPRSRGMLKDVVACWDHNATNLLDPSEIPAAGLSFTLPYPNGSNVNSTVEKNMSGYYKVRVWHWTGTAYEEVPAANVKPQKAFKDGIQVTYNKFSPIGATLEPPALDGTVKLSTGGKEITGTVASIGAEITAAYSKTAVGTLSYEWQISSDNGTSWSHLTTGAKYTPKSSDKGKMLRVNVTSDFETGAAWSKDLKVEATPAPVQSQYIINYGDTDYPFAQVGKIGNLTDEMEYYPYPQSAKPSASSAAWRAVKSGETHSGGLTEPGTYWVRFKTDNTDDSKTNWRSVTIQEYFTVTAVPDSVSTNRVVFTESPAYVTLIKGRVWLVPAGSKINVTASSANTKYYKINRITLENLATEAWTYKNVNSQNSVSTGAFTVDAPYYITASAGVYGSKTGDYSHLDLWMELAALSLMGLCAAVVVGRKKLRKQ